MWLPKSWGCQLLLQCIKGSVERASVKSAQMEAVEIRITDCTRVYRPTWECVYIKVR